MTLKFKDDGGTDHTITAVMFMDDDGVDRTLEKIVLGSNIIFSLAPDISVAVSPDVVGADAAGTGSATTVSVTATPTGGTAPYAYAWTLESIAGGSPTVNIPTSATTSFSITGISTGDYCTSIARCTVTDADSFTASGTCSVAFSGGV